MRPAPYHRAACQEVPKGFQRRSWQAGGYHIRFCLDPKDLNKAIQCEHYPLPTIEDIVTRLHGAKLFTILDVRSGFWHVLLDETASFLTTFHTPIGRYCWLFCRLEYLDPSLSQPYMVESTSKEKFAVGGC